MGDVLAALLHQLEKVEVADAEFKVLLRLVATRLQERNGHAPLLVLHALADNKTRFVKRIVALRSRMPTGPQHGLHIVLRRLLTQQEIQQEAPAGDVGAIVCNSLAVVAFGLAGVVLRLVVDDSHHAGGVAFQPRRPIALPCALQVSQGLVVVPQLVLHHTQVVVRLPESVPQRDSTAEVVGRAVGHGLIRGVEIPHLRTGVDALRGLSQQGLAFRREVCHPQIVAIVVEQRLVVGGMGGQQRLVAGMSGQQTAREAVHIEGEHLPHLEVAAHRVEALTLLQVYQRENHVVHALRKVVQHDVGLHGQHRRAVIRGVQRIKHGKSRRILPLGHQALGLLERRALVLCLCGTHGRNHQHRHHAAADHKGCVLHFHSVYFSH